MLVFHTMSSTRRTEKEFFVDLSTPPGCKNWISRHPLGQIGSDVVPSSSAHIGVWTRLSLTIPVQRHKMTGPPPVTSDRSAVIMIVPMGQS